MPEVSPSPRVRCPKGVCFLLTYLRAGPATGRSQPSMNRQKRTDSETRACDHANPSAQASPCDGLMGGMHLGKHAGVCPGMYMSALRVCVSRWCLLSPGGCVPVGRFSLSGTLFSRSRSTLSLSHSTGRAAARTLNDTAGTVRLQIIICQTPHQGKDRTSCTTAPSIGRWALHSGSRPLLRQGRR